MLVAGLGAGVIGSRVATNQLPGMNDRPPGVSISLLTSSLIAPGAANLAVVGLAGGRLLDFIVDKLKGGKKMDLDVKERLRRIEKGKFSTNKGLKGRVNGSDSGHEGWNVKQFNIPNWLPAEMQYTMALGHIRKLIRSKTYNDVKKKWIPPGCQHPVVMHFAKEIVKSVGDGREQFKLCEAITQWTHSHVPYALEEDSDVDVYFHPALVLESMDSNGICMPVDCDDQTAVNASLAIAVGLQPYFCLIDQYADDRGYNHILTAVKLDKKYHSKLKHKPFYFIDTTSRELEYDRLPPFKRIRIEKV